MHLICILIIIAIYAILRVCQNGIYYSLSRNNFYIISFLLIIAIGFRGEGVDHDYMSYVNSIGNYTTIGEPMHLLITSIISTMSLPTFVLFVAYAFIGVYCKLNVIYRLSFLPYVSIIIYLSNIILLQDINQIRAGAATSIFLLSIPYLVNREKSKFAFLILLASMFHFSALLFLILLCVSKKDFNYKSYYLWLFLPLIGYCAYYLGGQSIIDLIPFEPIREKLLMYKSLQDNSIDGFTEINLFNPYFIFKMFIYYFLFSKYSFLKNLNSNISLYIRIYGISLFIFPALGAITPILGYRGSDLFASIEILLLPYLFVLFKEGFSRNASIVCYFFLLFSVNIFYKHLIFF